MMHQNKIWPPSLNFKKLNGKLGLIVKYRGSSANLTNDTPSSEAHLLQIKILNCFTGLDVGLGGSYGDHYVFNVPA